MGHYNFPPYIIYQRNAAAELSFSKEIQNKNSKGDIYDDCLIQKTKWKNVCVDTMNQKPCRISYNIYKRAEMGNIGERERER